MLLYLFPILLVVLLLVASYIYLIFQKKEVDSAFLDLETIFKKRYEIVSKLFVLIRDKMTKERALFREVNCLKTFALKTNDPEDKLLLNEKFTPILKDILNALEESTEVSLTQDIIEPKDILVAMGEQINIKKKRYNECANKYNYFISIIPLNLLALTLKYKKRKIL